MGTFAEVNCFSLQKFYSLFLISCFTLSAQGQALTSVAGDAEKKISVVKINVSLEVVLEEIEKQAGVKFFYSNRQIDVKKIVSVDFNNLPLSKVLTNLFIISGLDFKRIGDQIVLKPAKAEPYGIKEKPIPNIQKANNKNNRNKFKDSIYSKPGDSVQLKVTPGIFTGTVVNITGEPLQGVKIAVSDTLASAFTDTMGCFSVTFYSKERFIFSGEGLIPDTMEIDTSMVLHVIMIPVIKPSFDKSDTITRTNEPITMRGAVGTVDVKSLNSFPSSSFESFLQGQVAGVQVINNSGTPAGDTYVRVRGNGSLTSTNRPVYVIDDVPWMNGPYFDRSFGYAGGQTASVFASINPGDIQSIEVLKDAAAIAMYGARGANGVVLISTKRGMGEKKLKIKYDSYFGIQKVAKKLNLLNEDQYIAYANEAIKNSNTGSPLLTRTGNNTDWQDAIFRTAGMQNHQLSFSGSDSLTHYYFSASCFKQDGTILGSGFTRGSGRMNMDRQFSSRLKLFTSIAGSLTRNNRISDGAGSYSVLGSALVKNPAIPVYNSSGGYASDPAGIINPVKRAREEPMIVHKNNFTGIINLNYELLSTLFFNTSFATELVKTNESLQPDWKAEGQEQLFRTENTLTYTKTIRKNHAITALAGWSVENSSYRSMQWVKSVITDRALLPATINSFFGKASFAFKNKYIFIVTLREDGSSRLGDDMNYGFFPTLAGVWKISDEPFLQKLNIINGLKLRFSHGITGSQDNITNLNSKGISHNLDGTLWAYPGAENRLNDARLTWEKTHHTDAGLDLNIVDRRVNVTADVYYKNSKDLLAITYTMTDTIYDIRFLNLGSMVNKGVEFSMETINLPGKLKWISSFNITFSKNTITSVFPVSDPNDPDNLDYIEDPGYPTFSGPHAYSIYRKDESFGSFYGYVYNGVDPQTGSAIYQDLNGDGKITEKDQTVIGNPWPKYFGAINNNFIYGKLELDFSFTWSYGNKVYNQTRAILDNMSNADKLNATTDVLNRWQKPGDITNVPRAVVGSPENNRASSRWVEDGSYLKLKNISLRYHLPDETVKRIKMRTASVYLSCQNLITFTKYSGYDPEAQNHFSRFSPIGIDWITYPPARIYQVGLHVGF